MLTSKEWKLEDELASELNVAASKERGWHVSAMGDAVRIRRGSGVDFSLASPGEQVGMIEGVIGLKPQLYSLSFLDLEVLVESSVHVPEARAAECAAFAHVG